MIDQRLARAPVVDQEPIEPLLLEHDPVLDAGRSVVVGAGLAVGGGDQRMIRLGTAVESGQHVGQRVPDVELVNVPP